MASIIRKLKSGQFPYLLILPWPMSFLRLSWACQVLRILRGRRSLSFSFNEKDFASDMASQRKNPLLASWIIARRALGC